MKNLLLLLTSAITLLACTPNELTKQQALLILKQGYPKDIEDTIFLENKYEVRRLVNLGLDKQGLIYIDSVHKPGDIQHIRFTEKADPYLIQTPDDYMVFGIMRVHVAKETLREIVSVSHTDDETATVVYTTVGQHPTPFIKVANLQLNKPIQNKVIMKLSPEGWVAERYK